MDLKFGAMSLERLATCDRRIQYVFQSALAAGLMDITIIEGRRSRKDQNMYFADGKSRVQWPDSKHNVLRPHSLSKAVDAAPWVNGAVSWKPAHCIFLAGMVMATAKALKVNIRWGGNWDMDREPVTDQCFQDLVHYELVD